MKWWGWVLIGLGVLALGYLKLKLFNKILQKRKTERPVIKDED